MEKAKVIGYQVADEQGYSVHGDDVLPEVASYEVYRTRARASAVAATLGSAYQVIEISPDDIESPVIVD